MLQKIFGKKIGQDSGGLLHRKDTLVAQIDFLLDTLEISKFDILYMEKLKMPLTSEESVYFLQQIDRIESSKRILLWMRNNIQSNSSFWKRLLRW